MTGCWCGGALDAAGSCCDSSYHDPSDVAPQHPASTIYVSGPMSGYLECNYPEFFRVAGQLAARGYTVVNPASNDTGKSYREIMKGDIQLLLGCDGVALLPGWERSTGATLEHRIAEVLQMDIRLWEEWL